MPIPIPTLSPDRPDLPEALGRLVDLAYNYWWTWHRSARQLFNFVEPEIWSAYRNPVRLLTRTRRTRWAELARNDDFLAQLHRVAARFDEETRAPDLGDGFVVYVSAEYALAESLPIYSGGLGVLSGDHLKEASDLGLPLIATGLFYRRGYFRQTVDVDGQQQHWYPDVDPRRQPLLRAMSRDGGQLTIDVELGDRNVRADVWVCRVGRVPLLLLDTNINENPPEDRHISAQLYPRTRELRLEQELVLGRGTIAVLDELELQPSVIHMNEGHSAFLALERMRRTGAAGLQAAREATRNGFVFTTHTPVPAGNEVFQRAAVQPYLTATARDLGCSTDELLELGTLEADPDGFNLTALALRVSRAANGVSELHAEVSRQMWPSHAIDAITNGIHVPTWMGREIAATLDGTVPLAPADLAARALELDPEPLWRAHLAQKDRLMRFVRRRALRQAARHGQPPSALRRIQSLLNPDALTLGFGRRFARYKRADLLFHDSERLERLLCDSDRPVQLVIGGKAHPADVDGQSIIARIWKLASSERMRGRIVLVEDYDLAVARLMVRGVDAWLNTPEWPMEASGTSGMKAAANGVLNVSVPDGWWAEGRGDDVGFTIGEAELPDLERDHRTLFELLEEQVVPTFYDRDEHGLPRRWIAMMRASMGAFLERFSTRRMLDEYVTSMYGLGRGATVADD